MKYTCSLQCLMQMSQIGKMYVSTLIESMSPFFHHPCLFVLYHPLLIHTHTHTHTFLNSLSELKLLTPYSLSDTNSNSLETIILWAPS